MKVTKKDLKKALQSDTVELYFQECGYGHVSELPEKVIDWMQELDEEEGL